MPHFFVFNFEVVIISPPLADKESTKMTNSEQGRSFQDVDKGKQTVTTVNRSQSPDGSKPSNKDDNRADDRYGNYNSEDRYAYFMF